MHFATFVVLGVSRLIVEVVRGFSKLTKGGGSYTAGLSARTRDGERTSEKP
jgi:hypothetical protein